MVSQSIGFIGFTLALFIIYNLYSYLEIYTCIQSNPNRIGFGFKLHMEDLNDLIGNNLTLINIMNLILVIKLHWGI